MLVVDAGPLVAASDTGDPNHERCLRLLEVAREPLVVPTLVVTEVVHLIASRLGPRVELAFVDSLDAGELVVEPVEPSDWGRIRELLNQYSDLGLGTADASVIATCERLGATELATLDHRHFTVVRPSHCDALTLLPA